MSEKKTTATNYALDRIIVKYSKQRISDRNDMFNLQTGYQIGGIGVKRSKIINPSLTNTIKTTVSIANRSNQNTLEVVELEETGEEAIARAIARFEAMEDVEYAEKCYFLKFSNSETPASNHCCLYGLDKIEAPKAWEITRGDNDIVVGIIDTGVDIRHPAIKNNLWVNPNVGAAGYEDDLHGYDFVHGIGVNGRSAVNDDPSGHGTHVAGTVAAEAVGACSGNGVAPNVKIAVIKVIHLNEGDISTAIEGINYANNMGIMITNNSYYDLASDSRALREAINGGGLFIACAGNVGRNIDMNPTYPASLDCENIITVAATDHNDDLVDFSNYGVKSVHLAAPGLQICSLLPYFDASYGDGLPEYAFRYVTMSGTSMAAPHVAGAAALVMSQLLASIKADPDKESMIDLIIATKNRLLENVDKIPGLNGKVKTGGRLNVYKAVKPQ